MMRKNVIVPVIAMLLVMSSVVGAEDLLISGDVNADQKVDLQDVIFGIKLMTGKDTGTVSPGGDVDGDDRIGLPEVLYQLQTIVAANAYLQPFIDTYLTDIVTEKALADSRFKDLERTFYLNGDTGPALKMPTIEFSYEGFDFSVNLGSYAPPGGTPEPISTVQVLLYDIVYAAWGFGINQSGLTSFLTDTLHGDDFSGTYSLHIDGIRMILDGTVKNLTDTDPSNGMLLYVTTTAGSEFLIGAGNTAMISASIGTKKALDVDGILEHTSRVEPLPMVTGGCPCPQVDMLTQMQKSFARQGMAFTADHLKVLESQPVFTCGDSFKAKIRLGSDLEVLESYKKLGERLQNNDFRRVEPAGYFKGASYLILLDFWSWWSQPDSVCVCQFSWEVVQVRTARILDAGFMTNPCGSLETAFDSMLGKIESGFSTELFMLSDNDYDIPYCEDGNPCTWDAFDLKIRECKHRAKGGSPVTLCDDGDLCTLDDKCVLGKCVGKPIACDDNNPCTDDACNPDTGQCQGVPVPDDTTCDDNDPVTENDMCKSGYCKGTINPDTPIPGVPFATGQPSFSPNLVTYGNKTTVSIPITAGTRKVVLRFWEVSERPYPIAMTNKDNLLGSTLVEIESPGIYADIYDYNALVRLEFEVFANDGAYSYYSYKPSMSETHYVVYQNDLLGHTIEKISDIPIAWLTVQLSN